MRIKSFYASTVEGAVALARREMGAEAMLVESRKAPLEARHLGEYEVVCALVPEAETAKPQAPEDTGPQDARLAREMAEMRRQLDVMGKTITRSAWSDASHAEFGDHVSDFAGRGPVIQLRAHVEHVPPLLLDHVRQSVVAGDIDRKSVG